jgi:anionic cell wall polymer biosynthesis LytR-Cps2A-Psr (LCP) family protein
MAVPGARMRRKGGTLDRIQRFKEGGAPDFRKMQKIEMPENYQQMMDNTRESVDVDYDAMN